MRLRNVKNKEDILSSSRFLVQDPKKYIGNWNQYFSNNHPIYLEIGMGKGQFLIQSALQNPDINFIGIEKYDSVVAKALPKIPHELHNICIVRSDAHMIEEIFQHEIDHLYLNFSDPWPKNRHHDRRLSSPVFLKYYDSIFKNVKEIEMRTDNKDLFEYSLVSFSEYGYILKEVSLDFHSKEIPTVTSEYEDKFSKNGLPIYYVKCIKQ